LNAHPPTVDWSKALEHLPEKDMLTTLNGPRGMYESTTPSGEKGMILRTPNDPAWYKGGLWNDSERINIPGLWMMTWYDVSVGPNLAAYNQVRKTADAAIADEQYAVIAPMPHCGYKGATEHTIVGQRDLGDARLDYDALTYGWFDRFLKGEDNGLLKKTPKVQYYTMGSNKWQSSDTWPPKDAKPVTYYLSSGGMPIRSPAMAAWLENPEEKMRRTSITTIPMNPCAHPRRRILLHGRGLQARRPRPAQRMEIPRRRPRLFHRRVATRHGSHRSGGGVALRIERRQGHRLHREA
jgi:putative CocE/NonD family hydrolase